MVELDSLGFSYPRAQGPLFDGVTLQLPAGSICGLLGPNGAGKSTLLKLMAGLLFPQQGQCRVFGQDPALREPSCLAGIFLLPEEFALPALVADTYAWRYASFYPRFDHARFNALLQEFELPLTQKLNTLSQGQKKKFLLAFGIATNTRLLILDEPTNGLDIPSKAQFRRVLLKHWDEQRSFLISTHQVHDFEGLIDAIAIIDKGHILLHETLDALSQRYHMGIESAPPQDALYFEESLNGYGVVRRNPGRVDSRLDLALLYGLVTSGATDAAATAAQGA